LHVGCQQAGRDKKQTADDKDGECVFTQTAA
jgi:hypothetical protein